MKSAVLKIGDKVSITQEFIDENERIGNKLTSIWKIGDTAKIVDMTDFSTVRVCRGIWSVWVTNSIAENMRDEYLGVKA